MLNAWRGIAPTPAALYRMMMNCPTLLLDEVEVFNHRKATNSESLQAVLAVLNGGHRKGATVPRCEGKNNRVVHFPVNGPKAFAAIGKLPDTLSDRSIVVHMHRKAINQRVGRFFLGAPKKKQKLSQPGLPQGSGTGPDRQGRIFECSRSGMAQ